MDFLERRFNRERIVYLMNILGNPKRVNDRQRRFHSEPRRVAGKPTVPANGNALAFPTPNSSHLVNGNHGNNSYTNHDPPRDGRRLQSLPPSKPTKDEIDDSRQVRSAPNNEGKKGQGSNHTGGNMAGSRPPPLPKSRISNNDATRDLSQRTHGKATRSYEESYLRSNKFASSWAQVRADNPAFHELSPDGSPLTARKLRQKDHHSPDSNTKVNSTRDSSPSTHEDIRKEHKKPVTNHVRGRSHHKTRTKTRLKFADENNNGLSPGRAYTSGEESGGDQGSPTSEQRERKVSKKREWVESVVVPPYEKPPPKYVSLRYLDSLTFKPSINTGKEVFQTYVVKEKKPVRGKTADQNRSFSDNEEGYESPFYDSTYSQDESDDNSQERPKKEPFLNRREAIKYIKMTNVYGSDAYKNQRKEWFIQKFAQVQETKAKYEAEQKREEKRKRQEDLKKQNQQLNYVRKKFRKEQEHRFRTQYVTARVLEYEHVNRHVYGLPEDFLDLANDLNREDGDDENTASKQNTESQENMSHPKDKHSKPPSKQVNKTSPAAKGSPNKRDGKKANSSPSREDIKKKKEEEEAMAALAKARENQKTWYAQPNSRPISPATDSKSHASHASSGYESEKQLLAHSENGSQPAGTDRITNDNESDKGSSKNRNAQNVPIHNKNKHNQAAQKRLESQKGIYAAENTTRQLKHPPRQQDTKQKTHVNSSHQSKPKQYTPRQTNHTGGKLNKTSQSNRKSREEEPCAKNTHVTTDDSLKENNPGQDNSYPTTKKSDTIKDSNSKPMNLPSNQSHAQIDGLTDANFKSSKVALSTKESTDKSSHDQNNNKNTNQGSAKKIGEVSNNSMSNKVEGLGLSSNRSKQDSENRNQHAATSNNQGANSNSNVKPIQQGKGTGIEDQSNNKPETKLGIKDSKIDQTKSDQKADDQDSKITPTTKSTVQTAEGQMKSTKQPMSTPASKTLPNKDANQTNSISPSSTQKTQNASHPNKNTPKIVTYEDLEDFPNQSAHPAKSDTTSGVRKDSLNSSRLSQTHQSPPKKNTTVAFASEGGRRKSRAESIKSDKDLKSKPNKKETVADRMFNIKTGPTWDPNRKTPKMEGIDTVVLTSKDKKGRDVKTRKDVKDVVKEADNLLKVNTNDSVRRGSSRQRKSRTVSPDLTLGSDFDVDDDDELEQDDIFERLRKKYSIAIDSDEENM